MGALERFLRFRLPNRATADDVLQEVCLTAYRNFHALKDETRFKPWLLRIAQNQCSDFFRARARSRELPPGAYMESRLVCGVRGIQVCQRVRETLDDLGSDDRALLRMVYFQGLPQAEIAARLGVPVGTVKSRLHAAKGRFRAAYPYPPTRTKGEMNMSILPDYMPKYEITPDERPPFPVVWEEMMGWFIVPKLREQISWAMYDAPGGRVSERVAMKVVGRAEVHGVEGVEIEAVQTDAATGREQPRRFIAQLTRTHCRALAESHREDGVNRLYTFLDGDAFLKNWGFGEDNCGNETHLSPKGKIARRGREITVPEGATLDAVDRCAVSICGKTYDTVRVMDVSAYCGEAIATEQFLDANGRTVLWRRFNRDDWQIERYGQRWTERLPDNERLTINGKTYVHWYDCITDGIM